MSVVAATDLWRDAGGGAGESVAVEAGSSVEEVEDSPSDSSLSILYFLKADKSVGGV